jgi:predicted NACHT family NTPase
MREFGAGTAMHEERNKVGQTAIRSGSPLQDGLLINSGVAYNFAYLSFQEFLAAANLIGDPHGNRRARVLGEFLRGDNWWKEVLSFYLELSSNTKELYEWISEAAQSCKGAESEVAGGQSRLALQHLRLTFPDLAF